MFFREVLIFSIIYIPTNNKKKNALLYLVALYSIIDFLTQIAICDQPLITKLLFKIAETQANLSLISGGFFQET